MDSGLILVLLLVLGAEFSNGWTDAPNAIATTVSTRALSPLLAILMSAIFNLLGVLSGTAVAATIGLGFVDTQFITLTTLGSAMVAIISWSILTAWLGLPTSETHALVAGLTGAAFATGGLDALHSDGWIKVILGLIFSTLLGFISGWILMAIIYRIFHRASPGKMKRSFRYLQILSSAFMSFSHGSNDGQKFMGVFTLTLVLAGILPSFSIPLPVILICAFIMAMGTLFGGWRIMRTMGFKITHLDTPQGFAAETAAASIIEVASFLGIPLSTTQCINASIMGVGSIKRFSAVRWGVTANIISAWVLTFPMCALIGFIVTFLMQKIQTLWA